MATIYYYVVLRLRVTISIFVIFYWSRRVLEMQNKIAEDF